MEARDRRLVLARRITTVAVISSGELSPRVPFDRDRAKPRHLRLAKRRVARPSPRPPSRCRSRRRMPADLAIAMLAGGKSALATPHEAANLVDEPCRDHPPHAISRRRAACDRASPTCAVELGARKPALLPAADRRPVTPPPMSALIAARDRADESARRLAIHRLSRACNAPGSASPPIATLPQRRSRGGPGNSPCEHLQYSRCRRPGHAAPAR